MQEKIWPLEVFLFLTVPMLCLTTIQDFCHHIKVMFILPNSFLIQPLDEGVILTFKTFYLKKMFGTSMKAVDDKNMSKRILEKFHC